MKKVNSLLMLGVMSLVMVQNGSVMAADESGDEGWLTQSVKVTVTVDKFLDFKYANPVAMTLAPGTAAQTADLETAVSTNVYNGFTMYMRALNGTYTFGGETYTYTKAPALEFDTHVIPAISGTSSLPSGTTAWGIGCKTASLVTCASANFIGLTTTDQAIASYGEMGQDIDVGLTVGATVSNVPAGTYRGVVMLTAMTNE